MQEKISLRGGNNKKGAQRHQNATAYHHNKNSKKTRQILALPISGLCVRCTEKLEWRKAYRKYKQLTVPKKCVSCQGKTIKDAYHVICEPCARQKGVCAKCQGNEEIVENKKSQEELIEELIQKCKLSSLNERQKRTYLRKLLRDGPEGVETLSLHVDEDKFTESDFDDGDSASE